MNNEIGNYLNHIGNQFEDWFRHVSVNDTDYVNQRIAEFKKSIRIEEGKKFIKVIKDTSVHSFIVIADDGKFKRGDILKAASWRAPAKNFARGNILNNNYANISWTGA
jgi:hypothetical protein